MFIVIRCDGCSRILTVSDHQQNILCPVCGLTSSVEKCRYYVRCRDRDIAEDIADQLRSILAGRKGHDLNDDEILMLRQRYEAWERSSG